MRCVRCVWFAVVLVFLTVGATVAAAENISGTLSVTRVIVEDSQLVGDVTCTMTTTPCIQFGAPNIALRLNGFTITGPANPDDTTTCQPASGPPVSDGISQRHERRHQSTGCANHRPGYGAEVQTARHPDLRGGWCQHQRHDQAHHVAPQLFQRAVHQWHDRQRDRRNRFGPERGQFGRASVWGNCLVNSNNNHIVNSLFGGNGSVCAAALCAAVPTVASNNDFGVGLIGTSSGNLIEDNSISGNSNGILIQTGASGNTIRRNIVAGNPPSQVSRTYGPVGFDIKDEAPTNGARNTFDRNWCITYAGPGPSACPSFPAVVPPKISALTATPDVLWPPNGQMVSVTIGVTVTDDSDPSPACQISSVTSSEPSAASDWSVTGPLSLSLRADRNGLGPGRIYSITVKCTNVSQLSASAEVSVLVPHDRR